MVPRQHFDDPTTRRDVGAKETVGERNMQNDGGVIPVNGFPHDGGKETRNVQGPIQTWCKHGHLIQHMHAFDLGRSSSRDYTFKACVFGAVRVVEGSSRSRGGCSGSSGSRTSWK